ncbi:MAG TPA: uroporphyrinogen decarboxylase family protein [Candidatus Latescibacteria bacterium]|nr:uroporphyrinogen decarboxylase family protein [Candidatus Latescibacterota bacterium]HOS64800.1 uroporphyrinogen decarboxylase family protein [Candidatus Latescibacterota bacterium]HPK73532.1 uroporphyrinogen decarboxylase family protein [Candidatus Latescibacterota bacterium]
MTSRERVIRALRFETPDRAPRDLWSLPGVAKYRKEELDRVCRLYPSDFGGTGVRYGVSPRAHPLQGDTGTYVDNWGCVWHVGEPGVVGEVKEPPIRTWSDLKSYKLPWEIIREADFSRVNETCAAQRTFVRAGTETRPFERMQFLRGSSQLFMDLAYLEKELYQLRDMLHEFFCEELRLWTKTDVDAIQFMDDWGAQRALLISPDLWRSFFKPLYREYCQIIKGAGKYVFFHSDGHIEAIYPDLIEIGVDALNSQLFCMNIEGLAAKYKGKITFWGEIDRQYLMPFGTTEEIRAGVRRVRRALDDGRGGVIAQCEWGVRDPIENVLAVFDEWKKPRLR